MSALIALPLICSSPTAETSAAGTGIFNTRLDFVTSLLGMWFSFVLRTRGKVKRLALGTKKPGSFPWSWSSRLRGALTSVFYCLVLLSLCKSRARKVSQAAGMGRALPVRHAPTCRVLGGKLGLVSLIPCELMAMAYVALGVQPFDPRHSWA